MSAQIIVLPYAPRDHDDETIGVVVHLSRRDYVRLTKLAIEWNVTHDEAASMMLSRELDPRERK